MLLLEQDLLVLHNDKATFVSLAWVQVEVGVEKEDDLFLSYKMCSKLYQEFVVQIGRKSMMQTRGLQELASLEQIHQNHHLHHDDNRKNFYDEVCHDPVK